MVLQNFWHLQVVGMSKLIEDINALLFKSFIPFKNAEWHLFSRCCRDVLEICFWLKSFDFFNEDLLLLQLTFWFIVEAEVDVWIWFFFLLDNWTCVDLDNLYIFTVILNKINYIDVELLPFFLFVVFFLLEVAHLFQCGLPNMKLGNFKYSSCPLNGLKFE